jgi:hypothetical protein
MNKFLQSLEITFRRDPTNFRPRVNKLYSVKDKEQKGPFSVDVLRAPSDDLSVQHREITSSSRSDFLWPLRRRPMYEWVDALDPWDDLSPPGLGYQGLVVKGGECCM